MANRIEIFSAGTHTDISGESVTIDDSALSASAAEYDPAKSEAPMVIGHPRIDAPAYGWIKKLSVEGGKLIADTDQVDPNFAEIVRAGRYKHVSASFYSPSSPSNPKPGVWYLRHVGFLGAQPPAVKGLKQVSFAAGDADGVKNFTHTKDNRMTEEELKAEKARLDKLAADLAAKEVSFSEAQAKASADAEAKRAADYAAREAAIESREKALSAKEHASFADGLIAEGKLLPAQKGFVVSFLSSMPSGGIVDFAEGGKKPMAESFKEFLTGLPKAVDFSEHASGDQSQGKGDDYKKLGMEIALHIPGVKKG